MMFENTARGATSATCRWFAFLSLLTSVFFGMYPKTLHGSYLIEDDNFVVHPSQFPPGAFPFVDIAKTFDVTIFLEDTYGRYDATLTILGTRSAEVPGFAELVYLGSVLDAGSDWYLGTPDQIFSKESIATGVQTPWQSIGVALPSSVRFDEDIWFGVNTGIDFVEDDAGDLVPRRDIFSWVQLRIDSDLDIEIVDDAMAIDAGQIVIGRNIIPEPASDVAPLALFFGLLLRRRATQRA